MSNKKKMVLENQLCFPLYVCSKEIIRHYGKVLESYNLTFTQYLVMLVLYEDENVSIKDMGKRLHLDSGTLTPVVNKLYRKSMVKKSRDLVDERVVNVEITDEGKATMKKITAMIGKVEDELPITADEKIQVIGAINKIMETYGK